MEIHGANMDTLLPENETNEWLVITSTLRAIQMCDLFKLIRDDLTITNTLPEK